MLWKTAAAAAGLFGFGVVAGVTIAPRLRRAPPQPGPATSEPAPEVGATAGAVRSARNDATARLAIAAAQLARAIPQLQPPARELPDRQPLAIADAPAPVRDVVTKLAASRPMKHPMIERRMKDGTPYYKAEFRIDGMEQELYLDATGTVVESELEMPPSQTPAAVRETIARTAPGALLLQAKKREGQRYAGTFYEVDVTLEGTRRELRINDSGVILRDKMKD